jgi:hypothetical protein
MMPGNKNVDEQTKSERTPYNIRADFGEKDQSFRKRLDSLVPPHLAERVAEMLSKRLESDENEDAV